MSDLTTPSSAEEAAAGTVDETIAQGLVERARSEGVALVGRGGLLTGLTKSVLETALEAELDEHLGYPKHAAEGNNTGNSRNGTRAKSVLTDVGPVELEVPRDREGSFEPQIVKKRQRRLVGVDELVISLAAKGLTTGEIAAHLAEVYGAEVSKDTVSRITEAVVEELVAWQSVQTCVLHLIRNSFRYASKADWAALARDLRPVYSAPTEAAAKSALDEVEAKWGERHPAIIKLGQNAWPEFVPFLAYSAEIRKVTYSTNAIEGLHARFRRAVRVRGHFPNEQAALKCLYLTIRSLDPTAEAEHAGSPAGRPR